MHAHTHIHKQTHIQIQTSAQKQFYETRHMPAGWLTCLKIIIMQFYTNILQLASSDPSEQCITPSHTCALWIQVPELSHLNPSSAEHVVLSIFQN